MTNTPVTDFHTSVTVYAHPSSSFGLAVLVLRYSLFIGIRFFLLIIIFSVISGRGYWHKRNVRSYLICLIPFVSFQSEKKIFHSLSFIFVTAFGVRRRHIRLTIVVSPSPRYPLLTWISSYPFEEKYLMVTASTSN